jgi:RNA polymerase sigma factor (TIGR02999 family)
VSGHRGDADFGEWFLADEGRNDVTALLHRAGEGSDTAAAQLLPLVYDELRALAAAHMAAERPDHTLQPTALVHEAYVRLVDQSRVQWQNRAHFFAIAAQAIRRVLVDHARAHNALKRGGDRARADISLDAQPAPDSDVDMVALDEALTALARKDERKAHVVELRFFAGLTAQETADHLDVSLSTVESDWRTARAWLRAMLDSGAAP